MAEGRDPLKLMGMILPPAVALGIILGTGTVHGIWTGRWAVSTEIQDAVARLALVPIRVGDWEGTDRGFPIHQLARFGFAGGTTRSYTDLRTGATVLMTIVVGKPGPISVHTPEVCYPGSGYGVLRNRVRSPVEVGDIDAPAEFWDLRVGKPGPMGPEVLSVRYAWSSDGRWHAPAKDARLEFAGEPVLFKLYLVQAVTTNPEGDVAGGEASSTREFAKVLLPILAKTLFPEGTTHKPTPISVSGT